MIIKTYGHTVLNWCNGRVLLPAAESTDWVWKNM